MLTVLRRMRQCKTNQGLRGFARTHGLAEAKLCQIERGQMYVPPAWREKLARILDVPIEQICDENGWPRLDSAQERRAPALGK